MQQQNQRSALDDEAQRHHRPRWVKAFVFAGIVASAILIAAMLLNGISHGPGQHQPDTPAETPTSHVPPVEHG